MGCERGENVEKGAGGNFYSIKSAKVIFPASKEAGFELQRYGEDDR